MYNPVSVSLPAGSPGRLGALFPVDIGGGGGDGGGGGGGGGSITRSFFYNEGLVNNMIIPKIPLTENYNITFDVWVPTVTGISEILISDDAAFNEYVFLSTNGRITVSTAGGSVQLDGAVKSAEYTTIRILKAEGTMRIESTASGGISAQNNVAQIAKFNIRKFGRYSSDGLRFKGVLANMHIEDLTLGKDYLYSMDEGFETDTIDMLDTGSTGEANHGSYQDQAHNWGEFTQDEDGDWAGESLPTPRSWPSDKLTMVVA